MSMGFSNSYSSNVTPCARGRKDQQNVCRKQNGPTWGQDYRAFVYIIPALAAILCYVNSLDGSFVHDDVYAIKENADALGKTSIKHLFLNDFWGKSMCDNNSHKSYRPFTVLTFRWDYYVGNGSPWIFHIVNVALHTIVTCLFVHVLRHVIHIQALVAVGAGLLFAVHPIHTEAVTGIVGRAELLSCLGVLFSVLCYSRSLGISQHDGRPVRRSPGMAFRAVYFSVSLGMCGVAMLCKEHGIMGLGICGALDIFVFSRAVVKRWLGGKAAGPELRSLLRRLSVIVCVGGVYMWFRLSAMCGQMPSFKEEDNPASFSSSWLTRVLTFNHLVAFNVWLLLCPHVLSYDWQVGSIPLITHLGDVRNLATLAVYLVLALAVLTCVRHLLRKEKEAEEAYNANDGDDDRNNSNNNNSSVTKRSVRADNGMQVLLVSLVLIVLPFLPSSNLFFRVGFVVAERVLYIPSLGFCLMVAHGTASLWEKCKQSRHRPIQCCLILSATALLLLLAGKTLTRNRVWRSRETLFWSGIQTLPHNAKMHYNYANFLKDNGHRQQAVHHYKTAISLHPTQPSYHNNLGTVLEDTEQAEHCYRQALRLNPAHRGALVNLANLLINKNDSKGEQLLHQALTIDPNYIDALLSLSQLELRRGRWHEAEGFIKHALRYRPDLPDLYNYYGIICHQTGQYEQAVASYSRALSINGKFSHAMTNAAASLKQLGRHLEAEQFLKRAVAETEDMGAMEQLGMMYQNSGRLQDAMHIYAQLAHKAPNDTEVLLNFVKILMDNGDLRRAEKVLREMISSTPHDADILFAMGHVHYQLGDRQQALSVFTEALRWVGDKVELKAKIHCEIGNMYKDMKHYSQALTNYHSSVQADPSLTHAHHNMGALYHLMGQYELARRHYEHVLRQEPRNQVVLDNMAKLQRIVHRQQGQQHQQQQQQHQQQRQQQRKPSG